MVHPDLPGQEVVVTEKQLRDVYSKVGWEKKKSPKKAARDAAKTAAEESDE